jgi:hypothetical protein
MYLGPADREVWTALDKLNAIDTLMALHGRVWELEQEIAFLEFERDQAYAVLRMRHEP